MKKHLSLIMGVVLIFLVLPSSIVGGFVFFGYLNTQGLAINVNYTGGKLLGEALDPVGDLLRSIPEPFDASAVLNSLDMTKLSVRLVHFPLPSGQGIENRLNLVAEFPGKFSSPADLKNGFGYNVIHFYIDSPFVQSVDMIVSDKAARIAFSTQSWDYEVIVDGYHPLARIYDSKGNFIGESAAVYVREETEPTIKIEQKKWPVKTTSVAAAIPLKLFGDVLVGEWRYFAVTGIADTRRPSFLLPSDSGGSDIFDAVNYTENANGIGTVAPLVIFNGKMK